jgi:hypothetical protein
MQCICVLFMCGHTVVTHHAVFVCDLDSAFATQAGVPMLIVRGDIGDGRPGVIHTDEHPPNPISGMAWVGF